MKLKPIYLAHAFVLLASIAYGSTVAEEEDVQIPMFRVEGEHEGAANLLKKRNPGYSAQYLERKRLIAAHVKQLRIEKAKAAKAARKARIKAGIPAAKHAAARNATRMRASYHRRMWLYRMRRR